MSERIALEVPASLGALSIVRMVLGGLGARLDFSLEELDDLYLAADRLLQAALETEELESITLRIVVGDGALRVSAGAFRSERLRARVGLTPGGCLDLCTLLRGLLDEVAVEDGEQSYSVVMVKRGTGGQQ